MMLTSAVRMAAALWGVGGMVGRGAIRDLVRHPTRRAHPAVPRTCFDPTTPEAVADPYPALARLRGSPVHVNEALDVWMISRYDDVAAAARDHAALSSSAGILLRSAPMPSVLTTDAPDHTRLRRVTTPSFTPAAVRRFEFELTRFVEPCIEALVSGEVVDAVPALTVPVPVTAIAVLLGLERSTWPQFRAWSQAFTAITAARSLADMVTLSARSLPAMVSLRGLFVRELHRRKRHPAAAVDAGDILDRVRQAIDGGQMNAMEALSAAAILLLAGNETTTNLMGTLLTVLARDPALYARLRDDRALLPRAIEEAARWASPVQWVARTTATAYRVGDVVIPPRSRVVLFYAGANRDPRRFERPEVFDVDRNTHGHLGYGHGAHYCMGAHLARLEVRVVLEQLLDRARRLELVGPVRWTTTPSLSGPVSVPLRATPA